MCLRLLQARVVQVQSWSLFSWCVCCSIHRRSAHILQACTSISSAQLIAMSSIFSFDVYGTYINKKATNQQLIRMSHIGVVGAALINSTLATAFHEGGVDLNWLLYFLGILIWSVQLPRSTYRFLTRSQAPVAFPLPSPWSGKARPEPLPSSRPW